jgi:aryl-alcohol dehydrogenase-like predicted oxidoreductase
LLVRHDRKRLQIRGTSRAAPAVLAAAQGDDIVPIPGTASAEHLEQNVAMAFLELTSAELASISDAFPPGTAAGDRYADVSLVNR